MADLAIADSTPELSPRELQVAGLIAVGLTTKQIGIRLAIATKTADCHRTRLMRKLGVHGIAGVVRFAVREGLV